MQNRVKKEDGNFGKEDNENFKNPIVICDDGLNLILKQITPELFSRAFHRMSGISTYTFLSIFSTRDSDIEVFFGQSPRHKSFKRKIQELVPTKYCITRGQVSITPSGKISYLHLFNDEIGDFSSLLGKKKLRELLKKIFFLIDESLFSREVLISLNGSLSHRFLIRGKRLKPVKK